MFNKILVCGGVLSGIGKGRVSASLGVMLNEYENIKIDPYLNADAHKMNPGEHGEATVLSDGTVADLDLGCYYRWTGKTMTKNNIITGGSIDEKFIQFNKTQLTGKTLSHVDKARFICNSLPEKCIIELGGCIDDPENQIFLEAFRQLDDALFIIHVTWIININGEAKTKCAQRSVKYVSNNLSVPNLIICRMEKQTEKLFTSSHKSKIISVCGRRNVPDLIVLPNLDSILKIPSFIFKKLPINLINELGLKLPNFWEEINDKLLTLKPYTVVVCGKYDHPDAYYSVYKSLEYAGLHTGYDVKIIRSTDPEYDESLPMVVPGGFGHRDTDRIINTIKSHKGKILGICFGHQLGCIAHYGGTSEEFANNDDQTNVTVKNMGFMRLGSYSTNLYGHLLDIYKSKTINPIYRNKYSVSIQNKDTDVTALCGSYISGISVNNFIGVQWHPEFSTTIYNPDPVFNWLLSDKN